MLTPDTKFQKAQTLHQQGQLAQAKIVYEEVLRVQPEHFGAMHFLGVLAAQRNQTELAIELMEKSLRLNQRSAVAYNNYGNALSQANKFEQAIASYDRAIALNKNYADAFYNRGLALFNLGRYAPAIESYDAAIALNNCHHEAIHDCGNVFYALQQYESALLRYDEAIAIRANYAEAHFSRGNALRQLGQLSASAGSYKKAIEIKSDYAEAYSNLGMIQSELKEFTIALTSYNQAISIKPDFAEAYCNRGIVLRELGDSEAALSDYDKAIALKPGFSQAHYNRAAALELLQRWDEALASCDSAIKINDAFAEAYLKRANLLMALKNYKEAIKSYDTALAIKPNLPYLCGSRLYAKSQICEWDNWDLEIAALETKVAQNELASPPFPSLALLSSAAQQRRIAEIWVREQIFLDGELTTTASASKGGKLRIGYFSADFRRHPISTLIAELFERHNRVRFEVIAFSFGSDTQDDYRKRIEAGVDQFIDVRGQSDREISVLARTMGIDIAIDLMGFTEGCRPNIFALRAAPVQVSYLGFLGTMGARYMDYLLADSTLVPTADQLHYAEKILYLPSYQVNDCKRHIADKLISREEFGLPSKAFVFCCFNASYKILPAIFDSWMRILSRVESGVLFLYSGGEAIENNLRKEARCRGIATERLFFGKRLPPSEYLARYRTADLFLDTLPYNAGTTASDALWAGLPVVTCLGDTFAGRMAASLLNAIELPELIAKSPVQYEELAVKLATQPGRLSTIKQRLMDNRLKTRLFDTQRFTRNIETAYAKIYERYQAGLPPDHIHVLD